ncbi:hypothetical protein Val02_43580 [Virgisporangium aliadipatigenens]|uniref:VWA domain containing CoxE-like protein n=1 Tax=Virgisporangium aliadipatigenens TaxID=741659 RepID=A0A8J4DSQ5_9ACTN|nr:DUF5682 family protein [Virgisporangium aliadipatigenens]GIJ47472.1 hypothetical protein Val02_43580 [Virgisporangium aliadipatigenens]
MSLRTEAIAASAGGAPPSAGAGGPASFGGTVPSGRPGGSAPSGGPGDPAPSGSPAVGGGDGGADPAVATDALAASVRPFLIGVRHHSPALSVAVPVLLEKFRPDVLLLELPGELAEWLPYLADPQTRAPVALAGVTKGSPGPAFYPFADFSPELVAVRWAARAGVPVVACDLPLGHRGWGEGRGAGVPAAPGAVTFAGALRAASSGRADEDMWDRMVEARAPGADPEAIRRAALAVGWALRDDAVRGGGVDPVDLAREAWMRKCLAEAGEKRVAALVGSFHAAALCAGEPAAETSTVDGVRTSLVPYTFPLLDSRSGYPAGIRDPEWQQAVVSAGGDPAAVEDSMLSTVVAVCARLRAAGHPAGPAEAREAVRLAIDLARLRRLPAPSRGELVEAVQTVLVQGETMGRGRVVAAAMERVLVGERRGALAPGTPRSGLAPYVTELLTELRLPGPAQAEKDLRLDPMRSDLDRRREVTLARLAAAGVPYATRVATEGVGGGDTISTRWTVNWTPETDAMLEIAGLRGVTLAQAAEGSLREDRRAQEAEGEPSVAELIAGLDAAATCGLVDLTREWLGDLVDAVPSRATLGAAVSALALLDRLRLEHVPGVAGQLDTKVLPGMIDDVETAAVRQVDGLAGSEQVEDARALAALAHRSDVTGVGLRLTDALARLVATGTPMIAGAAGAIQVLLGVEEPAVLGTRIGSWLDRATTPDGRRALQGHLGGLLSAAEPLLQAGGDVLRELLGRVETMPDREFLGRLPALRGGFHVLSPAARDRMLTVVAERVGARDQDLGEGDPDGLLVRLLADRAGREVLAAFGLGLPDASPASAGPDAPPGAALESGPGATHGATPGSEAGAAPDPALESGAAPEVGTTPGPASEADATPGSVPEVVPASVAVPNDIAPADRWRLLLGRESDRLPSGARRYATALDELYGAGKGEGSRADSGSRGGREAPFPSAREWADELADLFGSGIREEVIAAAVEGGRTDAALLLDPDSVRPSVELLQNVLTLAGGMPESVVARLRPIVQRIIEELTKELANRLRPALTGITTPRPSYRPGGPLDLARTLRANLASSHLDDEGRLVLVPEKPVFRTRARRSVDWRLVLVVDVSGSMEASVIWSALTAAVLAGVPALTTHFVAFSTEVVDLTDQAHDPLSLLLEVQVGGGTRIGAGLRYARELVTAPTRTMVVLVTDFEEGWSMPEVLAETRALVESGCTVLGCASLDDAGRPRYSVATAGQLVAAGMPVAALSPLELARWVGDKVRQA